LTNIPRRTPLQSPTGQPSALQAQFEIHTWSRPKLSLLNILREKVGGVGYLQVLAIPREPRHKTRMSPQIQPSTFPSSGIYLR
jgi:hypothetical protein